MAVPYSAARLLLLRTAAVLATCLPLVLAAALLVPAMSLTAVDQDPAAVLAPALLLVYAALGVAAALVLRLRFRHLTLLGSPP